MGLKFISSVLTTLQLDVKHKVKKMETINYEMYNWVAMHGKFYSCLSEDVNRPVKNGSWCVEIKLLRDMR